MLLDARGDAYMPFFLAAAVLPAAMRPTIPFSAFRLPLRLPSSLLFLFIPSTVSFLSYLCRGVRVGLSAFLPFCCYICFAWLLILADVPAWRRGTRLPSACLLLWR